MVQQLNVLSSKRPGFATLDDVRQAATDCRRCGLCDGRKTVVFSDGNPQARLMIIGEGPGQREDETGVPFVGKAGQLLDKILQAVQLDRKRDVYICNVVKCRPPQNRAPMTEEMDACREYLDAQINFVKPEIILLAGSTAVQAILKVKEPISRLRGKWFEYENFAKVMPVFHPAYLLRNDSKEIGSPKWLMWQDIKAVRRALDSQPTQHECRNTTAEV